MMIEFPSAKKAQRRDLKRVRWLFFGALGLFFSIGVAACVIGILTRGALQDVKDLRKNLTIQTQRLWVLKNEWAVLNNPERLEKLGQQYFPQRDSSPRAFSMEEYLAKHPPTP